MRALRGAFGARLSALGPLALASGCALAATSAPTASLCSGDAAPPIRSAGPAGSAGGDIVIVGWIVTMAEPAEAEAILIEAGLVTCVGPRDQVLAAAGDDVPVVDIGWSVKACVR